MAANEIFRFRIVHQLALHTPAFSHPWSAQLQPSRLPRVHQLEPCGAPKSRFLGDLRKTETPLHIAACFAHRKTRRRWRRSRSRRSARSAAARLLVSDFSNLYMASRFHIVSPSMTLEIDPEFSHYLR
ncbi:hypothetical protein GQ55_6G192900 [Panicum hallii var. hallii]|uniref:Uncharacterized protein n=1 Tax=Panicum hallii var. hallii TaxID=1504633 RepID=A0A2T7D7G2_9POAL|nr:hypothetical protein GQ55_6G192900 [Panicum hallii var. hallii]